jgi:hypothetical protein
MFWRILSLHLLFYNFFVFFEGYCLPLCYLFFEGLFLFVIDLSEKTAGKSWIRVYNGRLKRSEDVRFSDFFPSFVRVFIVRLEKLVFSIFDLFEKKR